LFGIAALSAGCLWWSGIIHLVDCWFSTIPATMSNNPPEKPPPHILAAGYKILRNLDIMQKALNNLIDKNGALNAFLLLRRCRCRCRCAAATATAPLPSAPLLLPLCHCRKATATVTALPQSSCRHRCAATTTAPLLPLLPPPCAPVTAPRPLPAAPMLPLLPPLRRCHCAAAAACCAAAAAAASTVAALLCH
jgi:hypothetical protein